MRKANAHGGRRSEGPRSASRWTDTWATSARRLGYPVSSSPQPGDAICFGRGVLGADTAYGHIAIVEEVRKDGSILISEANVKGVGVVSTRSITAAQLKAAGGGVQYIH